MLKKILVVDDESDILKMVKTRLEANGFEVDTSNSGKQGLQKARDFQPDLIIMDILMPDVGGGRAVELLKADNKTKYIPVVFLSAIVTSQDEERGINIADVYYPVIAKPFTPEKLLSKINTIIE